MHKTFRAPRCYKKHYLDLKVEQLEGQTKVTFVKLNGNIYVETDTDHYAFHGEKEVEGGVQIIAVAGNSRFQLLTSNCEDEWKLFSKEPKLKDYREFRDKYLEVNQECPAKTGIDSNTYSWSETFSSDQEEYSIVKLDPRTIVYSSSYFPKELAKVIISGDVIVFVHYNGLVSLKTTKCLYLNEQILYEAIKKIDTSEKKKSIFSASGEKAMGKYLNSHKINELNFNSEQRYCETYTAMDQRRMTVNAVWRYS